MLSANDNICKHLYINRTNNNLYTINKFFNEKELQNEKLCIEYKKKYYDAQNIADQITQIDSSNINLTDIARDMLETKKRIKELNDQNEKLEHENTYLRISYQNLYCENEGKNKSNNNQVNLLIVDKKSSASEGFATLNKFLYKRISTSALSLASTQ